MANIFITKTFDPSKTTLAKALEEYNGTPWEFKKAEQVDRDAVLITMKQWILDDKETTPKQ